MAIRLSAPYHDDTINDAAESDYGSDIDSATWDEAFSQSFSQPPYSQTTLPNANVDIEDVDEPLLPQQDDSEAQTHSLRLTRIQEDLDAAIASNGYTSERLARIRESLQEVTSTLDQQCDSTPRRTVKPEHSIEIEYDEANRTAFADVQVGEIKEERQSSLALDVPETKDTRSPIERFRKAPKKPLSVTDLVSPAWCELQYWYNLTKYGRIKRTPAMKQGSKIHKEKEREVHTEVPVTIATKEDRLGLRMWNIIQGLRTLRQTGLTRELEVFGIVDGEVIVGIIDEVSYNCPNEDMEAEIIAAAETSSGDRRGKKKMTLLPDQTTVTDFFASSRENAEILNSQTAWSSSPQARRSLYLVDIKTRISKTMPTSDSQMRPTQMQLMLYHRLLNDLAANKVDANRIFERYRLNAQTTFSDTFIAGLSVIDFSSSQRSELDDGNDEFTPQQPDTLDEITTYNNLSSLWSHMITEFAKTITVNAQRSSISPLLTAEFRTSADGSMIGQRSFPFEPERLESYVKSEMEWWRGDREAQGVEIEEAYKCGMCEFADTCSWRIGKIDEATEKARLRNQSTARNQV